VNKIAIIDYGVCNLLSVQRAVSKCSHKPLATSCKETILSSNKIILPGVGAFGNGMNALIKLGLDDVIREAEHRQIPILGICLGMQLLMDQSEEFGLVNGLGLISGRVVGLPKISVKGLPMKIPNIGWSKINKDLNQEIWDRTLLKGTNDGSFTYFVHSFMVALNKNKNLLATFDFGGHKIPAVINSGEVYGCQFHPEKSGEVGLGIIREFCDN
jgi:glutamine amidotransferase